MLSIKTWGCLLRAETFSIRPLPFDLENKQWIKAQGYLRNCFAISQPILNVFFFKIEIRRGEASFEGTKTKIQERMAEKK